MICLTGKKKFFLSHLQGCQRVVEDWHKILQVRSLVLSPQEDMKSWLKYSSLCRKSGRLALSHKTLVMLLGNDPSKQADQPLPTTYPQVTFAYMKHMWNENKKVRKLKGLLRFSFSFRSFCEGALYKSRWSVAEVWQLLLFSIVGAAIEFRVRSIVSVIVLRRVSTQCRDLE